MSMITTLKYFPIKILFQRLLQEKPLALRKYESLLEPEVLEILQRSNCCDSIECFATHRITYQQLREMSDKDLEKIGIFRLGDRVRILEETKKGATGVLCKANAPDLKSVEIEREGTSIDNATAPPIGLVSEDF